MSEHIPWIPTSIALPSREGGYLVTSQNCYIASNGDLVREEPERTIRRWYPDVQEWDKFPNEKVIAWQELPPIYDPEVSDV